MGKPRHHRAGMPIPRPGGWFDSTGNGVVRGRAGATSRDEPKSGLVGDLQHQGVVQPASGVAEALSLNRPGRVSEWMPNNHLRRPVVRQRHRCGAKLTRGSMMQVEHRLGGNSDLYNYNWHFTPDFRMGGWRDRQTLPSLFAIKPCPFFNLEKIEKLGFSTQRRFCWSQARLLHYCQANVTDGPTAGFRNW